jgi:nucleotidyltransferase/DNA polymerase involved in DNA repair
MATACVEKAPRKGYVIYSREESENFVLGAAGSDAGSVSRAAKDTVAEPALAERASESDVSNAAGNRETDLGGEGRGSWARWLGLARRRETEKPCRFVHVRVEMELESACLRGSAETAERVREILQRYAPQVLADGADGFVLDFAGLEGVGFDLRATIAQIPTELGARTGLAVRVGAGSSRAMATIASRKARVGGVVVVAPGSEELFLAGLAVTDLSGFPARVLWALVDSGIATVGRLRSVPKAVLTAKFGPALGIEIWKAARGLDGGAPFASDDKIARSLAISPDGGQNILELLGYLAKRVELALRDAGEQASEVGLLVRYADERSVRRCVGLTNATRDERDLLRIAQQLLSAIGRHGSPICGLELSVRVAGRRMAAPLAETRERPARAGGQLVTATA